MHRLAFRPVLRALRVQRPAAHAVRSARLASTVSSGPSDGHESAAKPSRIRINAKSALDPAGLYTPAEYVGVQLSSPEVQAVVKAFSPADLEAYEFLASRLSMENGHSDPAALNDIGEFLEERGVDLDLPDKLFESTDKILYPEYKGEPGV
ncbi:hypothetical protein NP233_g5770 [Leucocoprinus birnbaumii]|uniref:Uncharacterized protein n=1 Tax=Leucocoprinus birnbaumii TaxID=56174 RepID=A0AAD5VSK3_9AGAR|nr:hypothetical protein NP233_g5770 [Leucocoprinus birnbaumii]